MRHFVWTHYTCLETRQAKSVGLFKSHEIALYRAEVRLLQAQNTCGKDDGLQREEQGGSAMLDVSSSIEQTRQRQAKDDFEVVAAKR